MTDTVKPIAADNRTLNPNLPYTILKLNNLLKMQ